MKPFQKQRKLGALDWFCLRAIALYQRHISPRKGYRCAHARLHGGAGCSGFAREAIAIYGLRAALPQIKTRFARCKGAAQTLRAQQSGAANPTNGEQKEQSGKWCLSLCDLISDFLETLAGCGPGDGGCCDIGNCHCSPCD